MAVQVCEEGVDVVVARDDHPLVARIVNGKTGLGSAFQMVIDANNHVDVEPAFVELEKLSHLGTPKETSMAKFYTELNEPLREFIGAQHIFFHASAPQRGRINLSPKGLDTFRILNDRSVAYLDLTGSECETAAHLAENGRLTLMFCSFTEKPLILRLYGKGRVVHMRDPEWDDLHANFPTFPGERQIIVLDIESIMTTCGFAVPLFEFKGERDQLTEFACEMGDERMEEYRSRKNQTSIDGLPTYLLEDAPK